MKTFAETYRPAGKPGGRLVAMEIESADESPDESDPAHAALMRQHLIDEMAASKLSAAWRRF